MAERSYFSENAAAQGLKSHAMITRNGTIGDATLEQIAENFRVAEADARIILAFTRRVDELPTWRELFRSGIRSSNTLRDAADVSNEILAQQLLDVHEEAVRPVADEYCALLRELSEKGRIQVDAFCGQTSDSPPNFLAQLNEYRETWLEVIAQAFSDDLPASTNQISRFLPSPEN